MSRPIPPEPSIRDASQLLAVVRDPAASEEERSSAIYALRRMGDRRLVTPAMLISLDRSVAKRVRSEAIQALGLLAASRALTPLIQILQDRTEDVHYIRTGAARALGNFDDASAEQALLQAARDNTEPVELRSWAVESLASFNTRQTTAALLNFLNDPSADVRFWSIFALGSIGDTGVIPALERVVQSDDAVLPGWWSLKKEALDAIDLIRGRASMDDSE